MSVRMTGRIESVDIRSPERARIVLSPVILGDGKVPKPRYVRLTLIGAKAVAVAQPGAMVSALAVLRPPPEPPMPHGYDFARWAYFHRIGAVGFTYGAPKLLETPPVPGFLDSLRLRIENLRLAMTRRVASAVPGRTAASRRPSSRGNAAKSTRTTTKPIAIPAWPMCFRFPGFISHWPVSAFFGPCGRCWRFGRVLP